ncbi:MAG: PD-(D/E)XK nuclease family protein [Planctomycetes bacterium]|nr:PD-(D/E)XK nuclease family protein [Planctomycetota bacterium]
MGMLRENFFAIAADAQKGRYGTGRRPEDLLSAMLAALLHADQSLAASFFELLFCGKAKGRVEVVSQPAAIIVVGTKRQRPSPDMLLSCESGATLIEFKIDSKLAEQQLEDYLAVAADQSAKHGLRHVVAYIDERLDTVRSQAAQKHANYVRPAEREHFLWQDVYDLVRRMSARKSQLSELRSQFADFLRDRIKVASDLRPSYKELYSSNKEERDDCRSAFYQRYSEVREAFSDDFAGWKFKPGDKGLDQYCEALIPGTEAFQFYGRTNVVFRWVEDAGSQPTNWPSRYLQVSIRHVSGEVAAPKGSADDIRPLVVGNQRIRVGKRESSTRKDFLFDIDPWVLDSFAKPGLSKVLGACGRRVLEEIKNEADPK